MTLHQLSHVGEVAESRSLPPSAFQGRQTLLPGLSHLREGFLQVSREREIAERDLFQRDTHLCEERLCLPKEQG